MKKITDIREDCRIDFWMGIGATWSIIFFHYLGFLVSDYLSKDMMIGLAIVNQFIFCMLLGSMKNIEIGTSVILENSWTSFYLPHPNGAFYTED